MAGFHPCPRSTASQPLPKINQVWTTSYWDSLIGTVVYHTSAGQLVQRLVRGAQSWADFSPQCFLALLWPLLSWRYSWALFCFAFIIKKVLLAILYMLHSPDRSAAQSPFSVLSGNKRSQIFGFFLQDSYFKELFSLPHFPCCKI